MMKSLIILVLFVALLGGAGLSRPVATDFQHVAAPVKVEPKNVFERIFKNGQTTDAAKACDFRNRLLWTDVYLDGQRVATGAFGRWWWTADGKLKLSPKA